MADQPLTYTIPAGEKRPAPILLRGAGRVRVEVGAGAGVQLVGALVGEGRLAVEIELLGPGAEASLDALFLCTDNQHAQISVSVNHLHPDCRSRTTVKGIAAGHATGRFTGHIHVAPNALRTEALQQSRNILLSDTSKILTSPQLEIYADDVHCSHGATIGPLNPETLYYMRQRGVDTHTAQQLQLQGFIAEITRYIDINLDEV